MLNKDKFKKKLVHGPNYCDEHDTLKQSAPMWDSAPLGQPPKYRMICMECYNDSKNASWQP